MGNIYFECNKCGDALAATPDMAGDSTDCPKCGQSVKIPMESTVAPPPGSSGMKIPEAIAENKRAVVMLLALSIVLVVYLIKMLKTEEPVVEEVAVTNAPPVEVVEPEPVEPEPVKPVIRRGDTREMVLEALGKPNKNSKFGKTEIFVYDEFDLELTAGVVTGKKNK